MKRKIMHFIHGIKFVLDVSFYFLLFPLAYLLFGKKRYWLISEVDFDARDNGYHFFKYLNEKHKEINSIYLIQKNNPLYSVVASIGQTLEPGTFKHWLIYIASKYKIFTYIHGCCPNYHIRLLMKHIHSTGKSIALKHGISKNLHPIYFKKNAHLDMICCGAEPEYFFIDNNFGYKHGVAQYTGFARFDALHDVKSDNEIFIMPTWRRWLSNIGSINEFKQTEYYKNWSTFLTSNALHEYKMKYGLSIYYYVHPVFNKYLDAFKEISQDIVFLNSKDGNDIQSHLVSAKLLITDFSSVYFDFAYMKKPTIYYQFDEEKYYESHYIKAYFDYRRDGFGPVVCNLDQLINALDYQLSNGFLIEKQYMKNIDRFFPLNDNKNCERIFNAITHL